MELNIYNISIYVFVSTEEDTDDTSDCRKNGTDEYKISDIDVQFNREQMAEASLSKNVCTYRRKNLLEFNAPDLLSSKCGYKVNDDDDELRFCNSKVSDLSVQHVCVILCPVGSE